MRGEEIKEIRDFMCRAIESKVDIEFNTITFTGITCAVDDILNELIRKNQLPKIAAQENKIPVLQDNNPLNRDRPRLPSCCRPNEYPCVFKIVESGIYPLCSRSPAH
jgi:hypothetical protein